MVRYREIRFFVSSMPPEELLFVREYILVCIIRKNVVMTKKCTGSKVRLFLHMFTLLLSIITMGNHEIV